MSDTMKTARMSLRIDPASEQRIRRAAAESRTSVSEFVEQAAVQAADHTLADRTHFVLDPERWETFVAALDAPARDLPGMDIADAAWDRHFGGQQ